MTITTKKIDLNYIKNLIENNISESIILEFKKELCSSNKEIAKDISSFANSEGGVIIFGLEENKTGCAKSINWLDAKAGLTEKLESVISSTITPIPEFIINTISDGDSSERNIIVVQILKSERIHMVIKDNNNRFYIRMGTTIRRMEYSEIKSRFEISFNQENSFFDKIDQLDKDFCNNYQKSYESVPSISYYLVPNFPQTTTTTSQLKKYISELGSSKPCLGVASNNYKNTIIISNYGNSDDICTDCLIVHRTGILEYRRNLTEDPIFRSGIEIRKLGGLLYWGINLLKKMNSFGGLSFFTKVSNISKFGFSPSYGNSTGSFDFTGNDILEGTQFPDLTLVDDDLIKSKILEIIIQIGNYLGVNEECGYRLEKEQLMERSLLNMLSNC